MLDLCPRQPRHKAQQRCWTRNTYLAVFDAAQVFILDRTGKVVKTHQGLHTQSMQLAKDDPRIDQELRRFLSEAYNLKGVADYETGPDSVVPLERAAAAIETAGRFIDCIAGLIKTPNQAPHPAHTPD